ncbi:MAG TPA: hypothetical protein VFQ19_02550 [Nocardioidaceae bacterium]|jgi:hypothetical protein|nr:hypothetical protein [Nocardioidaceae bacterium]
MGTATTLPRSGPFTRVAHATGDEEFTSHMPYPVTLTPAQLLH